MDIAVRGPETLQRVFSSTLKPVLQEPLVLIFLQTGNKCPITTDRELT